jgi:hypothetical protein
MTARVFLLLTLAAILAVPFALKPARVASTATDDTVVVVTPHNEAIRAEYARPGLPHGIGNGPGAPSPSIGA